MRQEISWRLRLRLLALLFLAVLLHGCVSAWIDHSAGRFKHTFHAQATQTSIRNDIGTPDASYISGVSEGSPHYTIQNFHAYDVFDVTGKIHKPGDGAAQATVSAITLGIGELILIPTTIVRVAVDYTKSHTLVVFYDQRGSYMSHHLYDSTGKQEGTLGY